MTPRWSPPPHSLLRRSELRRRGVHPRRLASDEFTQVIPGFWTPTAQPAPLHAIAQRLQHIVCPEAVISHVSAAEILGLPLPRGQRYECLRVLHVSLPPAARRRIGRRVHVHRRRPSQVRVVLGVRLSATLPMLCDLALQLSPLELVQVCDATVGPDAPWPRASLAELRELAGTSAPRPGLAAVRTALGSARERVESPKETELRLLLLARGFAEPEINRAVQVVDSHDERRGFRLDLSYREPRIAIEYDGDGHRTDRRQWLRDRRKDALLRGAGWEVVRVTQEDLRDPADLVARLDQLGAPRAGPLPLAA